jgi:hypothetical protein
MHRLSYLKTILFSLVILTLSIIGLLFSNNFHVPNMYVSLLNLFLYLLFILTLLIASGGLICLWRDGLIESGKIDPIGASLNRVPTNGMFSSLGFRFLFGKALRPGDIVIVKSFEEIQSTLDADSSLDGLPFMKEMQIYCGGTFRVHRRVDKIYDMRHKTGLRCLKDSVTLTAVRCNGSHHGGCEAECQILWKDSWLRRLPSSSSKDVNPHNDSMTGPDICKANSENYICQMTRLWEATQPMSRFDIRQDLRPLLSGNVPLRVYLLVLLTRLFNSIQRLRGGIGYPYYSPSRLTRDSSEQTPQLNLCKGQSVVVLERENIAKTLVNNRNKGLWFDRDMVRYCGNSCVIRKSVDHIIHEATGKMVNMKTPSWILSNITATGEFLRLCPQHEHIYWREAWLRPADIASCTSPEQERNSE